MAKSPKSVVQQIRKATRKTFQTEEKIRIVLEGLRGEIPISDLCRKEGISAATYYKWSKDFLDAGKNAYFSKRINPKISFDQSSLPGRIR